MDLFADATDVLESLQPSDHEDNIPPKHGDSTDLSMNITNSFSNDSHSYINSSNYMNNDNICQVNSPNDSNMSNNQPHYGEYSKESEQTNTNNHVEDHPSTSNVVKSMDKPQLVAIIHFLKKHNLLATEEILRKETSNFINEDDIKSNNIFKVIFLFY